MGQQQLLLLVLGIVIVGLAVVVGIQAFGENQKKANADALVNDAVRIASDAQAFALKPAAFGGGDLDEATFVKLGYDADAAGAYENLNGKFTIGAGADCIYITGASTSPENKVYVQVGGTKTTSITTQINGSAVTSCTKDAS